MRQTEFSVILDHFLPFYPPNNPEHQNYEKLKKTPGDIIILHTCTKNYDHMLYCWNHLTDVIVIFHFGLFSPFYPFIAWKIKIYKKWKRCQEISSFYNSVSKIMIICYTIPEISCVMDVIVFHAIFSSFILTDRKIKIQKKKIWKKQLDKSSFNICVPKIMIRCWKVP